MRALHIIVLLIQRVNKSSFSAVFRAFEGKYIGRAKRKYVFEDAQNAQIQIYLTHAQSLSWTFPLHSYIL